jgi:putative membrane protein insertion efficiency factor
MSQSQTVKRRRTWASGAAIGAIRAYQYVLSPLIGPCCRFAPSCSHYACEAIERHGALAGMALGAWRVLRCNPFGGSGDDPVPEMSPFERFGRPRFAARPAQDDL